jgi:hypothetical protein
VLGKVTSVKKQLYLLSELATSDLCLHAVAVYEEEVCSVMMQALASFDTNLIGPHSYLKMYETYLPVLNGEAESAMMKFMKTEPLPLLEVREIELNFNQLHVIFTCLQDFSGVLST